MRTLLIVALAACLPSAVWGGDLPCTLTQADYLILANTESKATPDSVKMLSPDDQEMLCLSRANIDLVRKKNGVIDLKDVLPYDPQFLTKAEVDAIDEAGTKALVRGMQPLHDECRRNPSTCPIGK